VAVHGTGMLYPKLATVPETLPEPHGKSRQLPIGNWQDDELNTILPAVWGQVHLPETRPSENVSIVRAIVQAKFAVIVHVAADRVCTRQLASYPARKCRSRRGRRGRRGGSR
jgi:hypothetical protein